MNKFLAMIKVMFEKHMFLFNALFILALVSNIYIFSSVLILWILYWLASFNQEKNKPTKYIYGAISGLGLAWLAFKLISLF